MPRTTALAVGKLIQVDANISVDPFIEAANELVTEICVPGDYTDARLELIERWLAAHLYGIRDKQIASESIGRGAVSASYQYRLGLHLASTMQGQQAMILDTAGGLARLNREITEGTRRRTVGATWLGTEDE